MPIPPETIARIAELYEFHTDYALVEILNKVARQHEHFVHRNQPPLSSTQRQRQVALGKFHKRVSALLDTISELDNMWIGGVVSKEVREQLVLLQSYAAGVVATPKKRGGGPKPHKTLSDLVTRLQIVYEGGTGKNAGYTAPEWTPDGGSTPKGPFIDFVMEIKSILGTNITPSFIVSTLKSLTHEKNSELKP